MTKIRLPVSLKLITCKITETASITKTPPTTTSSSSCLQQIATTPIMPPIDSDPVFAGCIRKQSICKCHGNGTANRQAIESVGEIDGIRGTNNDEEKKHERKPAHVRNDWGLNEWHVERTSLHFQQRTAEKNARDN